MLAPLFIIMIIKKIFVLTFICRVKKNMIASLFTTTLIKMMVILIKSQNNSQLYDSFSKFISLNTSLNSNICSIIKTFFSVYKFS